jgi:hypothetical protein
MKNTDCYLEEKEGSATGLVVERQFQTCVHQFVMPGIDGYDEEERWWWWWVERGKGGVQAQLRRFSSLVLQTGDCCRDNKKTLNDRIGGIMS